MSAYRISQPQPKWSCNISPHSLVCPTNWRDMGKCDEWFKQSREIKRQIHISIAFICIQIEWDGERTKWVRETAFRQHQSFVAFILITNAHINSNRMSVCHVLVSIYCLALANTNHRLSYGKHSGKPFWTPDSAIRRLWQLLASSRVPTRWKFAIKCKMCVHETFRCRIVSRAFRSFIIANRMSLAKMCTKL